MRYIHGCKPRNPFDMIIQENHVAGRATLIIPYGAFFVKKASTEEAYYGDQNKSELRFNSRL